MGHPAAPPTCCEGTQRSGVGILLEGNPKQTVLAGRQSQGAERSVQGACGDSPAIEPSFCAGRTDGKDTGAETGVVVDAVRAETFRPQLDSIDHEGFSASRRGQLEVAVEDPQASPAAKMVVPVGVRLVADGLRSPEGGEQPNLSELGKRRVDGSAAQIGHRS